MRDPDNFTFDDKQCILQAQAEEHRVKLENNPHNPYQEHVVVNCDRALRDIRLLPVTHEFVWDKK